MRIGPMELLLVVAGPVTIAAWVLTIVALVDVIRVPQDSDFRVGNRGIWIVALVLLNCLGALLYYAVGRPARSS